MKKKTTTLFDTAIEVRAGYPDKKFFPTYNGRETKYAEFLSKVESMYEGDGLVLDSEGDDLDVFKKRIMCVLRDHRLKPPTGCRFSYRKFTEELGKPRKLLLSVVKKKGDPKQRKYPKDKHIIVRWEDRTQSQIEKDRMEEKATYRAYVEAMKEINLKRFEKTDPACKARRRREEAKARAAKKEAYRLRRVEIGKKNVGHLVEYNKEMAEKRRIEKEKLVRKLAKEAVDKTRRIEKRRLERSKKLKRMIAERKKREREKENE